MSPIAEVPTLAMESHQTNRVTMIALIFLLPGICIPIHASKELVDHGIRKSDERLFREIMKRLGSSDFSYLEEESTGSDRKQTGASDKQTMATCTPTIHSGTIIKAHESISAGAIYIDSIKGVKSNDNCLEYCCQNSTCDVAVYQDKDDRYCYLFQCQDHCIFKEHHGYFVADIQHVKATEQPEEDLKNLNPDIADEKQEVQQLNRNGAQKDENDLASTEKTTEKLVEPSLTEPVIAPHSVGLKGYCTQDKQCEDPNAACNDGNCLCHNGYYDKEGLCRKVCLTSSFECFELGTLSRGPECVPKAQVCDSYMQCADGSDEFNCDNIAPNSQLNNWSNRFGPAWPNPNAKPNNNAMDPFTQPVAQESNNNGQVQQQQQHQQQRVQQPSYSPSGQSSYTGGNRQMNSHPQPIPPARQVQNVQPNPIQAQPASAGSENTMSHNEHPSTGSNGPHYPSNVPPNQNSNMGYAAATSDKHPGMQPKTGPMAPVNSYPDSSQTGASSRKQSLNGGKNASPNSVQANVQQAQRQPSQTSAQSVNINRQRQSPQQSANQPQRPEPVYSEGSQYPAQIVGEPVQNKQAFAPKQQVSNAGMHENAQRPRPTANSDKDETMQSSKHVDQSLNSPQKIIVPSSSITSSKGTSIKSVNTHSQVPSKTLGKSKTVSQSPSKSHVSSYQEPSSSKSQSQQSIPNYANSQKWLDPSLYIPYGMGDSSAEQRQPQQPVPNQYFDPGQYYPPYANDQIESLQGSLLGNTGSADEFSQFGGPYLRGDKSISGSYQSSNQNSGYGSYPESPYGSQYSGSNRYDFNGEYRPPYQDQDFYNPIASHSGGSQQSYRPSSGLYEDFPSGSRGQKPSPSHKDKGKVFTPLSPEHKSSHVESNDKDEKTQAPKPTLSPTKAPAVLSTLKNKTNSTLSPHKDKSNVTVPKPVTGTHGSNKHVFMASEKVIIASPSSEAEGPIIALSLGLAFTLILLVLVGCRLRNVRHRLRKGRPLHQNEADYLINGMYL